MIKLVKWLSLFFLIFSLVACTQETSTTDTIAIEILESNPNADIFRFNNRIYQNNGKANSLEEGQLSEVGKIEESYKKSSDFEENMATLLPVGTKVFAPSESTSKDELYIKTYEGIISYKAEIEG